MDRTDSHGDVTGEYLALRTQAGLVRSEHELVWATGPDTVPFLQDLLSQELAAQPPGDVSRSLLLSPQGKLRALLWVLRGSDRVGMLSDLGGGEVVLSDLGRFRLRVETELAADERPVLEIWGPQAHAVLAAAGLTVPSGWDERGGELVVSFPLGSLPRFGVVGADVARLVSAGARPVGRLAATAVRIEAGEPRMGEDLDERTIPQESGLVADTVSFEKGCYLGQELVARIESRGHVNRHLRGVVLDENVVPPVGAEVLAGDKTVGILTSVAESLTVRAPIGLALLRREIAPGDSVAVRWATGEARASVRGLPLDDFTVP